MQAAFLNAAWRPDDFWHATPAEVLALLPEPTIKPLTRIQFAQLRNRFPDE